jgi:hypothetical protein
MIEPTIPAFSDGWLASLDLGSPDASGQGREVVIGLRRYDAVRFELVLTGVAALHVEGLREINEIDELKVVTGESPTQRDWDERDVAQVFERLFPAHANAAAEFHVQRAAYMADQLAKVVKGEATLVSIEGSADLVALCVTAQVRAYAQAKV